ncbi:hypothetical protein BDC45DRAFT_539073 [Circinella umbellata]|nr:hypothetical protein BDC45DRAFT_539073 [Circinella umbellata]
MTDLRKYFKLLIPKEILYPKRFRLTCRGKLPGLYGGRPVEIYSGGVHTGICFSRRGKTVYIENDLAVVSEKADNALRIVYWFDALIKCRFMNFNQHIVSIEIEPESVNVCIMSFIFVTTMNFCMAFFPVFLFIKNGQL